MRSDSSAWRLTARTYSCISYRMLRSDTWWCLSSRYMGPNVDVYCCSCTCFFRFAFHPVYLLSCPYVSSSLPFVVHVCISLQVWYIEYNGIVNSMVTGEAPPCVFIARTVFFPGRIASNRAHTRCSTLFFVFLHPIYHLGPSFLSP